MNKVFMYADPHFGHKNIINFSDRPFSSSDRMDEKLIKNWNSVVGKNDIIFVLGDFSLNKTKTQQKEIVQKLNGIKKLIMGNHDNHSVKNYYEMGFEFVSPYPIIYKDFFMLSHFPLFLNETMPYFNIYGHIHTNPLYKSFSQSGCCVCVERIGYKPIEFEEIKQKIEEYQNENKGILNGK